MSEWKMVKLGDLCSLITKGTTPTTLGYDFQDSGVNFVKIESITENGNFIINKLEHISEECNEKLKRSKLNENDILFSIAGALGRTAIVSHDILPANTNQALAIIRIDDRAISHRFVQLALRSEAVYCQFQKQKQGVAQLNLSLKNISDLQIPFPPLEIQQKIATVLDKASSLIELRKAQIEKLDLLVKSKFIDMFGDPVTNPMGWDKTTLNNIAKGKLTYGSGASAVKYDGVIRYIRITDISNNGKLNENVVSASEYDEKYILNDGDILFARSGATVGKTLLYRENLGKCIYAGYLIRLIPNPKYVVPDYVFAFTKTDYYMKFIEFNMKVVAQPNINAQQYGNLQICLPPLPLQTQFADFVEQVEQQKTVLNQSLKKLEMNYKALMQGCFNGELFQ